LCVAVTIFLTLTMLVSFSITGIAATSSAKVNKSPKLLPVDEAYKNADFLKFRNQMQAAVKSKNVKFIKAHVDKNIKNGFGGNDGIAEFIKQWNLNKNPEKSSLWYELGEVLRLGGSFTNKEKTSFMAPYVYSSFPEGYDSFTHGVIIGKNVNLRAKPSANSKIIAKLNYDIVEVIGPGRLVDRKVANSWRHIKLANGLKGYVAEKYFRSPVDYRGEFVKSKQDGVWRLTFFVAGD
jgi:hypothetical protein